MYVDDGADHPPAMDVVLPAPPKEDVVPDLDIPHDVDDVQQSLGSMGVCDIEEDIDDDNEVPFCLLHANLVDVTCT